MKKRTVVIAAAVAAVTVLSGCSAGGSDSTSTASGQTNLNVGVLRLPASWDVGTLDWGYAAQAVQAAYDTLIHAAPDGTFTPGLATAWSYNSPTEYQLTLRDGVTFADGTTFDAAAVKANIEHDKAATGPAVLQLADVQTVTVVDPTHVTIELSQPNPSMTLVFSQIMGAMMSPKAIADPASLATTPAGAGPYTLDPTTSVEKVNDSFVKNDKYWDAGNVDFTSINFKVYTDIAVSMNAYRAGELDFLITGPPQVAAGNAAGAKLLSPPGGIFNIILSDRAGTTLAPLGNVQVRQALNYAVNRQAIASPDVVPGVATDQFFGPSTEAYSKDFENLYPYDPDKAKALLTAAGYPNGFTLPVVSIAPLDSTLQVIASDLAKVGVTVTINDVPQAQYITARSDQANPAFFASDVPSASAFLDAQKYLLPSGSLNPQHTQNDQIIALYNKGAAQSDADRAATYQQMAKIALDDAWFLPVVQANNFFFYRSTVLDGVVATPGVNLPSIYTWKMAK